ncbi:GNAT family N-acetyltransferase [Microbacterium sp. ARD31]|uniref:GNAT family N-acetyltransferase n=1 Tax=Microbacterium sp. ARD31 TaxID=2962576 RepID=UPI0028823243|nr:GNAT family N-acetyltransferase [Microbacterium sp. ARD31]MDT0185131.1 GNAT family N-acetyltransferase [Microbacterium sp. ARD31]
MSDTATAPLAQRLADAGADASGPAEPRHPDIARWRGATRDDIDAMHAVFAAADQVDHPTWVTPREEVEDTFDLPDVDHAVDTILAIAHDGTVVAAGTAMRHPDTTTRVKSYLQGAVHPTWRRRGIGAELMRWQYSRALQQLAASGSTLPGEIDVYASDGNDGAVRLAEALGLRTARWFTSMVRDNSVAVAELADLPGITLVPYSADRAEDARQARNDAFRDHWGSLPSSPDRWQKFVGGPFLRPDLSTLALDADGRIVAFCLASVNEDDWVTLGATNSYIDLIGVVRDRRGQGLAPRVVARTLRAMTDAGLAKAVLDVDTESPTGANTLYERLGFIATERDRALVREF